MEIKRMKKKLILLYILVSLFTNSIFAKDRIFEDMNGYWISKLDNYDFKNYFFFGIHKNKE